jgi:FtsH-binding integral membrane protein
MATMFGQSVDHASGKGSIVDDFMYGSNVASSHVYIRLGFLRKVYGILSVQLLFTTIISVGFLTIEPLKNLAETNQWIVMLFAIASIVLIFAMAFKSQEYPINYILLGAFTFCESFLVGTVVTYYKVGSVIEAFALTCAVTVALTVYTFQSKRDFSSWGAGLFAALWVLILLSFMQLFFQGEIVERGIAGAGAILFSLFIIFDTHMIMNRVSPEEYIHASITLYLDIINLFLHILRAMGERKN